jgi:PAS domain S-box-containing protein
MTCRAVLRGSVLIVLQGLVPAGLSGQESRPSGAWRWGFYGRAEGVPPGSVSDIAETADGVVWVATDSGLAWFDGFIWHPVDRGRSLPQGPAPRLVPLADGGVLAVVQGRLYRGDTTAFVPVPVLLPPAAFDPSRRADTTQLPVEAVAPLGPADFLALVSVPGGPTPRKALVRLRDGAPTALEAPVPLEGSVTLLTTRSRSVYLSASGSLYRWVGQGWQRARTLEGRGATITALQESLTGEALGFIMSSVAERGLVEWDGNGRMRRVMSEGSTPVVGLDLDQFGGAAAVYATGHVRVRDRGRWADAPSLPPPLRASARAVRFTNDGNLWFGADDGVYFWRARARRWTGWSFPFPDQRAQVNAVLIRRSGAVWTGTGDGVLVYRPDRRQPEWIRAINGVSLGGVTGLAEDGAGAVWVSSGFGFPGAFRWDGRSWRHFGAADGLAAPRVHRVAVDRHGLPWFLGLSGPDDLIGGPGAFRYRDGGFERWGVDEGLPSGRVYAFAEQADGTRWFATLAGVSRWRAGVWTHWDRWQGTFPDRRPIDAPLGVRSIAVGAGRVWLGDRHSGVGFADETDSLRLYPRASGLGTGEVRDVQVDHEGVVWAATARGVCFLREDVGEWSCIGPEAGLATGNVWPIVPDPHGIYLGTQGEGLQVLSRAEADDPPPRVVFGAPIVEGRITRVGWEAFAYRGAVPKRAVRTRHRIDGGAWSPWSTDREVSLAGMPPGRHAVQVQARGLFGAYDREGATAAVVVPFPLVLRPAFAVPVGALFGALVVVLTVGLTHRGRAVRTLRASEARFRSLGEAAFEGIGFTGEDDVVEVNERLAEMFGYARDELIGGDLERLVAPQSREAFRQLTPLMRHKTPGDAPVRMELWGRRRDGSTFPAEIQVKAMPFGDRLVRVVALRDISERHEAEAALRRSEEKFAKAFWASPDAIHIAREADGRFIEVNEAFVRLSGRPRDLVIGRTGAELGLWADDLDGDTFWSRLRAEGRVGGFECRLRGAEGEVRHCVMSAERLAIGGEPCVLALTRDVTEFRRTVVALRMTQFSVDHAADAVLWVDPDGRIRYANASAAASLEYEPSALVGAMLFEVNEAWSPASWRDFWALVKGQGATLRVSTLRTRRGRTFPAELLCHHMTAEGRERLVVGARDISERIAAERAVVASEMKFATAFRSSPDGMALVRAADGVVLEANDAVHRLLGRSRERITMRSMADLGVWATAADWEAFRDLVVASGSVAGRRLRLGGDRIALLSAESLELGSERCLLCVLQDVTDEDRARQALDEHRAVLRTLSRQLMAAHEVERTRISRELHDEIGQALAAVKLNLQAIGRLTKDDRIGLQVQDGIAVVDATVDEVRNLSRDLRPSVLDDLGLAAALQWYLGRQAERAGLTVAFTPQPELPRAPRDVETACYRIAQEAMTNVLRHAHATRVDVEVAMRGTDLVLCVRDNGRGFSAGAPGGPPGGPGHLGLVGMRERAETAGGVLVVESAPGAGTTVWASFDTARARLPNDALPTTGATTA